MELFKLFGTIAINNQDAVKSLQSTDDAAKGTAGKIAGLGDQVNGLISRYTGLSSKQTEAISGMTGINVKAIAAGAAVTAIGVAAVKAAADLVSSVSSMEDEIDKMSQKIGISTTTYQELDYAFGQSGIDISILQSGMKTLNNQIDSAASGNKTAQASFEKLGVSVTDSSGNLKDSESILKEVISALADMPDNATRAALGNDLLGKSSSEMAPLLNEGSDGIQDLTERANELGLVMDETSVDAGVKYGDTIDDVNKSFQAIGNQLGNDLMPYFQSFADWILDNMPTIQSICENVFSAIGTAIDILSPIFSALGDTISGVLDIVEVTFNGISDFLTPIVQTIEDLINGIIDVINTLTGNLLNLQKITTSRDRYWDKWASSGSSSNTLSGTSVENDDGTTTYYSKYYKGENANGGIIKPGEFGTVGESGIELIQNVGGNAVITPTSQKTGGDQFNISISASSVKEFNDIIRIAKEARLRTRMG